uniref:Alpha-carbonic anhydrase domain-containing protein n=1 Tax=Rhodnius prolixus TaxID=13249 RepID=T1HLI3_RHOPR
MVNGVLTNTGHSVLFRVDNTTRQHVNFTGGPLSYKYQLHHIHIHYGLDDGMGSEHTINGHTFPAEMKNLKVISDFRETHSIIYMR